MPDQSDYDAAGLPKLIGLCPDSSHAREFYMPHGGTCPWCDNDLVVYVPRVAPETLRAEGRVRAASAHRAIQEMGEHVRELEAENKRLRATTKALVDAVAPIAPNMVLGQPRWDLIRDAWETARDAVRSTASEGEQ